MPSTRPARLPDFLGIGPGRAGTTWLHNVLEGSVDLPRGIKETQFFNFYYHKGIDWYAWHFRCATGDRPVVEICPYFNHPEAPARVRRHLPECRFVSTLRNPVDHAYSAYKLLIHFVWARGTLEEVLATRPHLDIANAYATHLKRWFDHFGHERFLILLHDDLRADPQAYIDRVTRFMNVPRIDLGRRGDVSDDVHAFERRPKSRRLAQNARHFMYWLQERRFYRVVGVLERAGIWQHCYGRGEKFPALTEQQEEMLLKRYLPEIDAVENLLGIDLSAWKQPRAARPPHSSARGPSAAA